MNDDDILVFQRALRRRFFEGAHAVRWRPGRELLAQLLLYLDDPEACWRLSATWLRETLDADRVDGGYGGFVTAAGRPRDYIVLAEAQREDQPLPSMLGRAFDARSAVLRAVWEAPVLLPIRDVGQAAAMTSEMRTTLLTLGTASKLAIPIQDGSKPVGLICSDWHKESPRWSGELCLEVGRFMRDSLGPLMAASARLSIASDNDTSPLEGAAILPDWQALTAAERKVAGLVMKGVSYKEIARSLDRSLSTVDHQLRSIRQKLGVRSTARLVHLLSEHFDVEHP